MSQQWLWKHQDKTCGPINTEELQDLISLNKILDSDQLQIVGKNEWVPATKIKEMFRRMNALKTGRSSQPDTMVLSKIENDKSLNSEEEHSTDKEFLPTIIELVTQPIHAAVSMISNWTSDGADFIRLLIGPKTLLVIILLVLIGVAFRGTSINSTKSDRTSNRERFLEVSETWVALEEFPQQSGSDVEWNHFKEKKRKKLEQIISDLGNLSTRDTSMTYCWFGSRRDVVAGQRVLLSATRYLLPIIDSNSPPNINESESWLRQKKVFSTRMISAHDLLSLGLPDQKQLWGQYANQDKQNTSPVIKNLVAGLIVIDIVLVMGGGLYWWKRQKSR